MSSLKHHSDSMKTKNDALKQLLRDMNYELVEILQRCGWQCLHSAVFQNLFSRMQIIQTYKYI